MPGSGLDDQSSLDTEDAVGDSTVAVKLARVQTRMRQLEALSVALSEAISLDQVATAAVTQGLRAMGASVALLAVLTPDEQELELVAASGVPLASRDGWRRFPTGGGSPLARAVRESRSVFVESLEQARATDPAAASDLERLGAQALVAVPVRANGQISAAMALAFEQQRAFEEDDRGFIAALAAQCAQALLRSKLYTAERLARRTAELNADRARRLQEVTAALSDARGAREVVQVILERGLAALGAEAGGVVKLSDDGLWFEYVDGIGFAPEVVERYRKFPVNTPVPTRDVAITHRPVFIESIDEWKERYSLPDRASLPDGSWAALPLKAGDNLLGALTLRFPKRRRFDDEERRFMMTLAHHCAQALERGRLYEAAISANRVKAEFLAMMSHELRTPLTAILGYTDLLENEIVGPISKLQRDHLQRVRSSGEHLLILIQDLLSFSRLEAGRETVCAEPFQVGEVVDAAISMVRPLAERRGLALMSVMPDEPVIMNTDAGKIRQILVNLFANAIKFTDRGGVALNVLHRIRYVEFRVADTGIGIPSEHLERIFDAFWQVDQSTTRRAGGAGLGLSIARQLARLLGGDVWVVSESGAGSTFTAIIPLHAPGESAEPA